MLGLNEDACQLLVHCQIFLGACEMPDATKASRTVNRAIGVNQSVRLLRVEVGQEFQ